MSEPFVVSMEKDIGEDGAGKEWRGVPCLAHLAGHAPETKPGQVLQELSLFPEGLQVSYRTEKPRAGCGPSSEQGKTRWLVQHIPLPRHTTPPIPVSTTLLLPAHDPTLWGYPRPEQEARGLLPVLLFTPTWHIDIWKPEDLGSFWTCPGGWLFPQTQPHSDSMWCSLPTRF